MVAAVIVVAVASLAVTVSTASGAGSVRGFDGTTIKTAGFGDASTYKTAEIGTEARFKRANDTNEVKGVKFEYTGWADEKFDPTTALSEARRLVTQEQVFAIVPDLSPFNPGEYLNQQHVPYLGWAFDDTYCSNKATTSLYGVGYNGCLVPKSPPWVPDAYRARYAYVSKLTGKKSPTIAMFSQDNQSGQNSMDILAVAAKGAGFDVVSAKGNIPATVGDYTPYVQALLTSANGSAPDFIDCELTTQCLPILNLLNGSGFKGTFSSPLYTDILVKPLAGTVASVSFNVAPNAGLTQMQKDFDAIKPGANIDTLSAGAYFAADKLIMAAKKVGKSKITPESVQKVLATMTWSIKGLVGPNQYPASTVGSSPSCQMLMKSDGTKWDPVVSFACSSKQYKVK